MCCWRHRPTTVRASHRLWLGYSQPKPDTHREEVGTRCTTPAATRTALDGALKEIAYVSVVVPAQHRDPANQASAPTDACVGRCQATPPTARPWRKRLDGCTVVGQLTRSCRGFRTRGSWLEGGAMIYAKPAMARSSLTGDLLNVCSVDCG